MLELVIEERRGERENKCLILLHNRPREKGGRERDIREQDREGVEVSCLVLNDEGGMEGGGRPVGEAAGFDLDHDDFPNVH